MKTYAIIQRESIFGVLLEPEEVAHLQANKVQLIELKSDNIKEEIKKIKKEIGEPYVFQKEKEDSCIQW